MGATTIYVTTTSLKLMEKAYTLRNPNCVAEAGELRRQFEEFLTWVPRTK